MGWMPRASAWPIPPRATSEWSTQVNRGFQGLQCPRIRQMDLLSGFERPSPAMRAVRSLNSFVGTWSARAPESRAYSSAG